MVFLATVWKHFLETSTDSKRILRFSAVYLEQCYNLCKKKREIIVDNRRHNKWKMVFFFYIFSPFKSLTHVKTHIK